MEIHVKTVEFERPDMLSDAQSGASRVAYAWARVPPVLSREERDNLKVRIKRLLKEREAVLVVHYYVDADLQDLAKEAGGCVSDSLEMVRFGRDHSAKTLIVAGVCFMGETTKILSSEKTVLMLNLDAICLLDLGCPPDEFVVSCDAHPDHTVAIHANISAAVKARAGWMATSPIGLKIVQYLHVQGKKTLWTPDRHLGSYIQKQISADMPMWQDSYLVHDELKGVELDLPRVERPNAKILAHPESSEPVVAQADVVGSTSQLIAAAQSLSAQEFIVATDNSIPHKIRMAVPGKRFIEVLTAGNAATCKSCAHCPWMAMSTPTNPAEVLETGHNGIHVDPVVGRQTTICINRMLDFVAREEAAVRLQGDLAANAQLS